MKDTAEFLKQALQPGLDLRILAIAFEFPDFLIEHRGPIVYLGSDPPKADLHCSELIFKHCYAIDEILQALNWLGQQSPRFSFDLVFIDHNHSLEELVPQINATIGLTRSDTTFIFDDAVPPDIAMTGPVATEDWWVGEVWMLAELFRQGRCADTCYALDLPPTGLLLATGLRALPLTAVSDHYAELQKVATLEQLRNHLPIISPGTALARLRRTVQARVDPALEWIAFHEGSEDAERSIELDGSGPWERPAVDFVLDLSDGAVDVSSLYERGTHMAGKRLDTYTNAQLTGLDSFVSHGWFFCKQVESPEGNARRLIAAPEYSHTPLRLSNDQVVLPREYAARASRIPGHSFFATPDEPFNWGMWILYAIPSVHEFLGQRGTYDRFLIFQQQLWQRRLLQHLGLSVEDIAEHQLDKGYVCERMSVIRYQFRNLAVNRDDSAIFQDISARFEHGKRSAYGERIYVARNLPGGQPHVRPLENEFALAEGLRARGFTILRPETLEFPEQVRAFAGARMVVGLGGAAMFNTVFCRPGTRVVTIESRMTWVGSHVNLFTSMGLSCGVIIGRQYMTDPEPVHKRWWLDTAAALRQIDRYLC